MIPLAFLMSKCGPDESVLPFGLKDLVAAVAFCALISSVWLAVAVLMKKKGQPLRLSPSFWYVAGPAAVGLVAFVGVLGVSYLSSIFR